MTSENQDPRSQGFDPQAAFVDEKGYEYDNLGAYISGRKKANGRNKKVADWWSWEENRRSLSQVSNELLPNYQEGYIHEYLWAYYSEYDSRGEYIREKDQARHQLWSMPEAARRFQQKAEEYRAQHRGGEGGIVTGINLSSLGPWTGGTTPA